MSEKRQNAANLCEKIKGVSNLTYIILGLAVLIMICIAAGHYQTPPGLKWKSKYNPISQIPGVLYGCPSWSSRQQRKNAVMLSFVGGPSDPSATTEICQKLSANNLTALFFLSPNDANQNAVSVKKIFGDNHQIGIYINENVTNENIETKIKEAETAVKNITNIEPRFLNIINNSLTKEQLEKAKYLGYTVVITKPIEEHKYGEARFLLNSLSGGSILSLHNDGSGVRLLKSFIKEKDNEESGSVEERDEKSVDFLSPKQCFDLDD